MQYNHFNAVYNSIHSTIPFDQKWANGTDYYDKATRITLAPGALAKSYDDKTRRKLIFVGTRFGAIVIFERYSEGKNGIYVNNWPYELTRIGLAYRMNASSSLSQDTICSIVGDVASDRNIGTVIEGLCGFEFGRFVDNATLVNDKI